MTDVTTETLQGLSADELEARIEQHRPELTGYCYRMLGSSFEADDAVQETMVRAWKSHATFEGRSAVRSWLYRIATNVCLDHLNGRNRRARPMDFGPATTVAAASLTQRPENTWLEPVPDGRVLPTGTDPADLAAGRESIRLAFVAALQHLPPRQRAVLIFREVLRWKADEVAELLDTTTASVNSALQRARATLAEADITETDPYAELDPAQQDLVARYVDAFERYDMESLTALLADDARMSMPPYELWLTGTDEIAAWMLGPGFECKGSRLVQVNANGAIAFGQYRPSGPNGEHEPWALVVLEVHDGRVVGLNSFLDTAHLFPLFDLPPVLAPA